MKVTENDFLTVEVMNYVLDGLADVRRLLAMLYDVQVNLRLGGRQVEVATVPFPMLINALERDLDMLAATGFDGGVMPKREVWYGELFDRRRLDYTDVNRWLSSIALMKRVIGAMVGRWVRTSVGVATGGNNNRQLIRSVR